MVNVKDIAKKIKEKKELENLDDEYVKQYIESVLTDKIREKMKSARDIDQFCRSKEYTTIRSTVRAQLRETYGVFNHDHLDREELLAKLVNEEEDIVIRQILSTHQSTQERLPYFTKFYRELFAMTGCPSRILDIGCGLNPISYPFLEKACGARPRYACCDISTADVDFLNTFFKTLDIPGEAITQDALDHDAIVTFAKKETPDMIFLLKLLDTLENLERHTTKKLLTRIGPLTKWLVVSFATVSLGGGKRISDYKRTWFEKYLDTQAEKDGWTWETYNLPNELVYVIATQR